MQYVARLHTTRAGVNPLQSVQYGSDLTSIGKQAVGMLVAEPVGAWVEVSERVEIPRVRFEKVRGENNEISVKQVACVVSRDVERAASTRQEPGSSGDAGKE